MEHNRESSGYPNHKMNDKKSSATKDVKGRRQIVAQEGGEDVDKLADAFICKFRQQLRIQREESLKRHKE